MSDNGNNVNISGDNCIVSVFLIRRSVVVRTNMAKWLKFTIDIELDERGDDKLIKWSPIY